MTIKFNTVSLPCIFSVKSRTNLEPPCQEFVLDFQEIAFSLLTEEWFIDNLEPVVILDVLPPTVPMTISKLRTIHMEIQINHFLISIRLSLTL
jgi:hypothetical protein